MDQPLYPLIFEPQYLEKVWGGRALALLGAHRTLPGDEQTPIGESWELADLSATATSGAGGGAVRSAIANGPLRGMTLHEAMRQFGERLLGRLHPTEAGDFPLLVKYLDARQALSVQTHPSLAYAQAHPQAQLKSEAWYIVAAEPGAVIYKGVLPGVDRAAFAAAVDAGDIDAVMRKVAVKAGDCHYLPSGMCHALGAGIVVAEVQTPSDTTFRVYDWGRTDRETHLDEALEAMTFDPVDVKHYEKRTHIAGVFTAVSRLITCDHFRIERVRMSEAYEQEIPYDQPTVWMVLEGAGRVTTADAAPVDFAQGHTLLMPARMTDAKVHLKADTRWLEISFPQTQMEQIA